MHPSNAAYNENSKAPRPPPPPATGIPVGPTTQYCNENPQLPLHHQNGQVTPWSTGLCDCHEDVPNCCITCCCPCITFGQIAEIVDKGTVSCGMSGAIYGILVCFTGCGWLYSCLYRPELRDQYMLEERPCNDCLVHFCCEACALCQEYRELQNRGFDMAIGWHGNMERQNGKVAMAPPAPVFEGGMSRQNVDPLNLT